jgi:RimJ/RimL family protein N-acetyltransferase
MKLSNGVITLKRVTFDDIEMIRNWRNDPKISQYMFSRDYITKEMQIKWFERINNQFNYFFIILYKTNKIGLCELKNIDYHYYTAEAGMFIYDDKYRNGIVPYASILLLMDFAFYRIKIKKIIIKILDENKRAIRFN